MKVCIFDKETRKEDVDSLTCLGLEVNFCDANDENLFPEYVFESDILIVFKANLMVTAKTMVQLKNCFAIIRASVGYDNIDINSAAAHGIYVFNVPDYGTADVADHTIAMLLSYMKRICVFNENLHSQAVERVWNPLPQSMNHRISTLKLGIIGLGRIGGAVAQRLRAFGVQIYFYDPYLPDGYDQVFVATRVNELKELFKLCDVVSIHTPLTHETEGMITLDLLRVAKKRMIIINCARGKILRNHTIVEALKQNLVEAFILDTIEEEPIKIGEELYSIANHDGYRHRLLITPHAASYDIESRRDMHSKAIQLVDNIINDAQVRNCVNKELLATVKRQIKVL